MSCGQTVVFTERDIPDLRGYVTIVTGGNSGIGYETALQLALKSARVYIASRSRERVDEAILSMKQTARGKQLDLRFLQVDLQSLKSTKTAAESFLQMEDRLDILINNAGIMAVPYKLTMDGYESTFQVNYLSRFVFTQTVLPLMLATAAQCDRPNRVRIVNLASEWTRAVGPRTMQLDDVNLPEAKGWTKLLQRYSHSHQGGIRYSKELSDRYSLQGLTAYSLHPGVIRTNLQGHDPGLYGKIQPFMMMLQRPLTTLQGSYTTLYCATSADAPTRGQGRYFVPGVKLGSGKEGWLDDRQGNKELWDWSENVLRGLD